MPYRQQYDGHLQSRQQRRYGQQQSAHLWSQQTDRQDRHEQQCHPLDQSEDAYEQWDMGYYGDDHDQHGSYEEDQHVAQTYSASDQMYQKRPPLPHPQQQSDPRNLPPVSRNGQRDRGGLRPPGLDRSLFNHASQEKVPLDNPFPTFSTQRAKQPAQEDTIEEAMAHMNINSQSGPVISTVPAGRGLPASPGNWGAQISRSGAGARQDSGHFDGDGQSRRHSNSTDRRPPPTNNDESPVLPRSHFPAAKSPTQRSFNASQRSLTTAQDSQDRDHGGYDNRQRGAEYSPDTGHSSSADVLPDLFATGGVETNRRQGQDPPNLHLPPQQQHIYDQNQAYPTEDNETITTDAIYDDYYAGSDHERKSVASTIDMPNFDAIPEPSARHRRGDSIDHHLSPCIGSSPDALQGFGSTGPAIAHGADFKRKDFRDYNQSNLYMEGNSNTDSTIQSVPSMNRMPRTNTDFVGVDGSSRGPLNRGPPRRGMTIGGAQQRSHNQINAGGHAPNLDPRWVRQQRLGEAINPDDIAYLGSSNKVTNFSPPVVYDNPIHRPSTAGPVLGRPPHDPLGYRPGTSQPYMTTEGPPAHPAPVRAGLMQYQQQPAPFSVPSNARPPPIRQYNNDGSPYNLERSHTNIQQSRSAHHPVTHDELNRLRIACKAHPTDNATVLQLAKKLAEASTVLADEGGSADSRTRNKNRDKFVCDALKIVRRLVGNGYPAAMFYLADCYGQGLLGLQADTKEAFSLYQSAAKAGHASSVYRTAVCYELGWEAGGGTRKDPLKAVQWYRRAAALGDTPASYKMGMILLKGLLGQQKNLGEALNMLKRAASQADEDNPHALHELALIYESSNLSERIIRDEGYALQLLHQAADLGYKFSQFRLGQAYEYGLLGCQIDARTSIAWYTRAAAQEEHQSELALSGWYLTGIQGVLEQSDTEAYLWARKAACGEPPLPKAMFAMGYFTEVGIGCPRSLEEAKRWYGRAGAYKFPKAQERLEELKRGGSKVQLKRERVSRSDQKHQDENCRVM